MKIDAPGASSARSGSANGRNPIGIIVPCHRVYGLLSGSLTGYGGGSDRKRALLDMERSSKPAAMTLFD